MLRGLAAFTRFGGHADTSALDNLNLNLNLNRSR